MSARTPSLSWTAFFRRLTPRCQRAFERSLADSGLLLGEFMELVETAYLEAHLLQEASLGRKRVDVDKAAKMFATRLLGVYIRRKRLFLYLRAAEAGLADARRLGALPKEVDVVDFLNGSRDMRTPVLGSYRARLRSRIHSQIEAMKRAGAGAVRPPDKGDHPGGLHPRPL